MSANGVSVVCSKIENIRGFSLPIYCLQCKLFHCTISNYKVELIVRNKIEKPRLVSCCIVFAHFQLKYDTHTQNTKHKICIFQMIDGFELCARPSVVRKSMGFIFIIVDRWFL